MGGRNESLNNPALLLLHLLTVAKLKKVSLFNPSAVFITLLSFQEKRTWSVQLPPGFRPGELSLLKALIVVPHTRWWTGVFGQEAQWGPSPGHGSWQFARGPMWLSPTHCAKWKSWGWSQNCSLVLKLPWHLKSRISHFIRKLVNRAGIFIWQVRERMYTTLNL